MPTMCQTLCQLREDSGKQGRWITNRKEPICWLSPLCIYVINIYDLT